MKTSFTSIVLATCALAGIASAGRAPAGPDFQSPAGEPVDVIPFSFDSSALDVVSQVQLDEVARWLERHPGYRLVIAAHTDAAGSDAYNVGLAARRARVVRDALVRDGVAAPRVVLAVYGKSSPPSRHRYAAANRVAVIYATTRAPQAIAAATLPAATAVLWTNRATTYVASRGPDLVDALVDIAGQSMRL